MGYGLSVHAREQPGKPALVEGDRVLRYADFDRRTNRLANALCAGGIEEGYLFICDRKIDMIISGGVNVYPRHVAQGSAWVCSCVVCRMAGRML